MKTYFSVIITLFALTIQAQENDLDKLHSKEEIRKQLHKSFSKFTSLPIVLPQVYEVPLFSTLTEVALKEMGFSKKEIAEAKNNAL
jgi:hypothetical protein